MSIFSLTLELFEKGGYTHPGYQVRILGRIRIQWVLRSWKKHFWNTILYLSTLHLFPSDGGHNRSDQMVSVRQKTVQNQSDSSCHTIRTNFRRVTFSLKMRSPRKYISRSFMRSTVSMISGAGYCNELYEWARQIRRWTIGAGEVRTMKFRKRRKDLILNCPLTKTRTFVFAGLPLLCHQKSASSTAGLHRVRSQIYLLLWSRSLRVGSFLAHSSIYCKCQVCIYNL